MSSDRYVDDRDELPQFPIEFWDWPRERQIDWIAQSETRRSLISKLLVAAERDLRKRGDDDDPAIKRSEYMTEKDLAAIYRTLVDTSRKRRRQ